MTLFRGSRGTGG